MTAHFFAVRFFTVLLCDLEGNDVVGLPFLTHLLVDHRRAAAVLAKAYGVVLVCGEQLRAARGTDIYVAVKLR